MNILIISGSPRKSSKTVRVAQFLKNELAKKKDLKVQLCDVRDWNLPMIQAPFKSKDDAPEHYQALFEHVHEADAFLLVTPEYNGSYAPALKNLLDHFTKGAFKRKAFGIATASPGNGGGMRAAQQLLLLAPALFGIACPHMFIVPKLEEKIDEDGLALDESMNDNARSFLEEFLWLAHSLAGEKVEQAPA